VTLSPGEGEGVDACYLSVLCIRSERAICRVFVGLLCCDVQATRSGE
jgi:hypothetical protein